MDKIIDYEKTLANDGVTRFKNSPGPKKRNGHFLNRSMISDSKTLQQGYAIKRNRAKEKRAKLEMRFGNMAVIHSTGMSEGTPAFASQDEMEAARQALSDAMSV